MSAVCLQHTRPHPNGKGTSWAVLRVERGSEAHEKLLADGWTPTSKSRWRKYLKQRNNLK